MGQVHLEVIVEKMKRKFGVEVLLKTPKVPYLETIRGSAKVQGKYKKQSGGRGQYGDCWIELSPLPRGEGYLFEDKIVGGVIPRQYIPAVDKGIQDAAKDGFLAGYPVVDFKVALLTAPSIRSTPPKWPSRLPVPWPSRRRWSFASRCSWSRS